MNYYFSSSYQAILKIDGINHGNIYEKTVECKIDSQALIEICPIVPDFLPLYFIIDKDFYCQENHLISITDLQGGYGQQL